MMPILRPQSQARPTTPIVQPESTPIIQPDSVSVAPTYEQPTMLVAQAEPMPSMSSAVSAAGLSDQQPARPMSPVPMNFLPVEETDDEDSNFPRARPQRASLHNSGDAPQMNRNPDLETSEEMLEGTHATGRFATMPARSSARNRAMQEALSQVDFNVEGAASQDHELDHAVWQAPSQPEEEERLAPSHPAVDDDDSATVADDEETPRPSSRLQSLLDARYTDGRFATHGPSSRDYNKLLGHRNYAPIVLSQSVPILEPFETRPRAPLPPRQPPSAEPTEEKKPPKSFYKRMISKSMGRRSMLGRLFSKEKEKETARVEPRVRPFEEFRIGPGASQHSALKVTFEEQQLMNQEQLRDVLVEHRTGIRQGRA